MFIFRFVIRSKEELQDEAIGGVYPYVFRVGPTCIQKDEPKSCCTDDYRSFEAKLHDSGFKFDQYRHNLTECKTYLDVKNTLNEEHYECLAGTWFAPNHCHLEKSSFSTIDDNAADSEIYHVPIPLIKSYVQDHDSCGSILLKKITNPDIDWITEVILKKSNVKAQVQQDAVPPVKQENSYTQSFGQTLGGAAGSASNFFFG